VQQQDIQVAARKELPAAVAADRDESHPGLRTEQIR
jgi:hypothetical protein